MDSRTSTIDDLLRMAREDILRNSIGSAEKTLEQAILLNNQSPEAFYLLGYTYSKKGKFKKAIAAFQRTLQLDPGHTDAAIALSSLYNDVGKYREGALVFTGAKKRLGHTAPGHDPKINQGLALKHFELALLYLRFERFKESYHEFAKALNLDPNNVSYAIQMAKCLSKMGDKPAAITLLKKAMESDPNNVEAKIQLGILFHSQQLLREAEREWKEAKTLDPSNKSVQMYLKMLEYEPGL